MDGLHPLAGLSPERLLTMRYEDFIDDPETAIARFAAFVGPEFVDMWWVRRMACRVRPSATRASTLHTEDRQSLDEACRPGFAVLADLYPEYERSHPSSAEVGWPRHQ